MGIVKSAPVMVLCCDAISLTRARNPFTSSLAKKSSLSWVSIPKNFLLSTMVLFSPSVFFVLFCGGSFSALSSSPSSSEISVSSASFAASCVCFSFSNFSTCSDTTCCSSSVCASAIAVSRSASRVAKSVSFSFRLASSFLFLSILLFSMSCLNAITLLLSVSCALFRAIRFVFSLLPLRIFLLLAPDLLSRAQKCSLLCMPGTCMGILRTADLLL